MSRQEDDYIAGLMAAEDRAQRLRADAERTAAEQAEAKRRAALPRYVLDEEQAQRIASTLAAADVLARQIAADYLKLSATHKQRLATLATDLQAAMRVLTAAPLLTVTAPPARADAKATPRKPPAKRRASKAATKGRRP